MITVIINPISGGASPSEAQRRADVAASTLAACSEDAEIFVTQGRGHARELAAGAAARGARLVMAWGGDGTINEAGSALIFGPTPLAIVPSGSGNGLARELGVSQKPAFAIAAAAKALPRAIDAGELGGRPFFNMAGVGFDAHVASRFDHSARRGLATYLRVAARELLTYRSATYRIGLSTVRPAHGRPEQRPGTTGSGRPDGTDGRDTTASVRNALLVTFANSPQFGNGACIALSARLDDGRLDLVVFEEVSRFATVCAIPRLFTGGAAGIRGLSVQQIERATIESDTPMTFHVDGEPVKGGTAVEARVLPAALKICV